MTDVTTTNGSYAGAVAEELDLDALLGRIDVSPQPVRLAGRVYQVRRDLTSVEATRCLRLISEGKELEATSMLLAEPDDGVALDQALRDLPHARREAASVHILRTAGLPTAGGDRGESPAS